MSRCLVVGSENRKPAIKRVCLNCGADRYNRRKEWCDPCYDRWKNAGRPESGPPEPRGHDTDRVRATACQNIKLALQVRMDKSAARVEDYGDLRYEFGESRENAAARVGVGLRTAWRYEARLRAMSEPQWCSGRCDCGQPCSKLSREGHLVHVCLVHDVV